jgi:FkbM family methyltransferase
MRDWTHYLFRPTDIKDLAYRFVPKPFIDELRHRKHLRDLATAVEPEEAELRKLIHPGFIVLDIGANFGVFTKLFSQLVGPQGFVIAFEPVPQTFRTLAAGIERYHRSNVQAKNEAVSDHEGAVLMAVPQYEENAGDNLYQASIVDSSQSPNAFTVKSVTVDSLQLSRVDFIKIDVEGHELEVLHGSRRTLEQHHPTLMVEVTSPRTVEFLCATMGYGKPAMISPSNQLFVQSAARNPSGQRVTLSQLRNGV